MSRLIYDIVQVPSWEASVMFVIGEINDDNKKEFYEITEDFLEDDIKKDYDFDNEGCCYQAGQKQIIWLPKFKYNVLAHEILHAVFGILENVGMEYDSKTSEEAYTYLMGYLMKEIVNKYNDIKAELDE